MPKSRKMPVPAAAEVPLPEGDSEQIDSAVVDPETMPEGWQLAYQRAITKGCGEKGARLYADAHGEEFEQSHTKTKAEIDAEIERLTKLKDTLAS